MPEGDTRITVKHIQALVCSPAHSKQTHPPSTKLFLHYC